MSKQHTTTPNALIRTPLASGVVSHNNGHPYFKTINQDRVGLQVAWSGSTPSSGTLDIAFNNQNPNETYPPNQLVWTSLEFEDPIVISGAQGSFGVDIETPFAALKITFSGIAYNFQVWGMAKDW